MDARNKWVKISTMFIFCTCPSKKFQNRGLNIKKQQKSRSDSAFVQSDQGILIALDNMVLFSIKNY